MKYDLRVNSDERPRECSAGDLAIGEMGRVLGKHFRAASTHRHEYRGDIVLMTYDGQLVSLSNPRATWDTNKWRGAAIRVEKLRPGDTVTLVVQEGGF